VYQQEYFLMSTTLTLRTAGLPLAAFGGAMLLASTALSAPLASIDVDSVVGQFENATDVAGSGGGVGGASDHQLRRRYQHRLDRLGRARSVRHRPAERLHLRRVTLRRPSARRPTARSSASASSTTTTSRS
jgi:hypothetical protein